MHVAVYPQEFFGDEAVEDMSGLARALYALALIAQAASEKGSLPPNPETLCANLKMDQDLFASAWPSVESVLPVWCDGRRRSPRMAHERHKAVLLTLAKARGGMARKKQGLEEHSSEESSEDTSSMSMSMSTSVVGDGCVAATKKRDGAAKLTRSSDYPLVAEAWRLADALEAYAGKAYRPANDLTASATGFHKILRKGYPFDTLSSMIEWLYSGATDASFWRRQVRTGSGLLRRSKSNGDLKVNNVLASYNDSINAPAPQLSRREVERIAEGRAVAAWTKVLAVLRERAPAETIADAGAFAAKALDAVGGLRGVGLRITTSAWNGTAERAAYRSVYVGLVQEEALRRRMGGKNNGALTSLPDDRQIKEGDKDEQ